jgi:hypothetical protein
MSINEHGGYELTEKEIESLGRLAMKAAYKQIDHLREGDLDDRDALLSMLKAFSSAQSAMISFERKLLQDHPEAHYISHPNDVTHFVCSAVLSLMWVCVEDTNPHNFWALRFVPLLKASQAMEAYSSLFNHVGGNDLELFGDYGVDDILRIATRNEAKQRKAQS